MILLNRTRKIITALVLFAAISAVIVTAVTQQTPPQSDLPLLADEAARTAWLELRGWHVDAPEITQMRIPEAWQTQQGQSWLRLQAAQGLHPEHYAGCDAVRYLYPIAGSDYMYAELILCEDVLVGAQVYDASTRLMQSVL